MTEIDKMIEWYLNKGKEVQSINILLDFQLKLSGYSYYLAEKVAKTYAEYSTAEHLRKTKTEVLALEYNLDNPITTSRSMAVKDVAQYKDQEICKEVDYKESKLKLDQVNKILDGLMQRISYLKREQEEK